MYAGREDFSTCWKLSSNPFCDRYTAVSCTAGLAQRFLPWALKTSPAAIFVIAEETTILACSILTGEDALWAERLLWIPEKSIACFLLLIAWTKSKVETLAQLLTALTKDCWVSVNWVLSFADKDLTLSTVALYSWYAAKARLDMLSGKSSSPTKTS